MSTDVFDKNSSNMIFSTMFLSLKTKQNTKTDIKTDRHSYERPLRCGKVMKDGTS